MAEDFLPDNYEVPTAANKYMKFEQGENRFRIMCSPILGWEAWEDLPDGKRNPMRHRMDDAFTMDEVEDPMEIKHFWAMVVWNYKAEKLQILEITQKTIQKFLKSLAKDKDWGTPVLAYDIVVTKRGEKKDTEYDIFPKPKSEVEPTIMQKYLDSNIDLEKLFLGEDPFLTASQAEKIAKEVAASL
jgi:hypothetical protein